MSDAVAIGCAVLIAWALFDLARAVRRMHVTPFTLVLKQETPHVVHHDGTVRYTVKHDEPREPWQGD